MMHRFIFCCCFLFLCTALNAQPFDKSNNLRFDVLNYKLSLDLYNCYAAPYKNIFTASEKITVAALSKMDSLQLNASSKFITIDSVSLAAKSFKHAKDTLKIALDKTYKKGEVVDVQIFYHHNDGKDYGSFSAYGGYVFTDCEPEGAREWFVCNDVPSDKATVDITAKVPSDVLLGSNGSLEDSVTTNDTSWFHWVSHDALCTYLVTIASRTNYQTDIIYWHPLSHPLDSIPIRFYSGPNEPSIINLKNKIIEMMNFESSMFGDYPFEKNGFASLNKYFLSEGMENQTLTTLCRDCWQEWLVFHELTHQWFGDMISPKSWADIFMNEGFAAYSQVLWAEHSLGYAQSRDSLLADARYYLRHNKGFAISEPSWALHTPPFDTLFNGGITYDKAACVVDQLRYILGDSVFFHMLKAYTADTVFRFRNVSIHDFNDFINSYTHTNYDWFFNEWIFSPNHPVYENSFAIKQNASGWKVNFTIKQTQTNTVFFTMPVEINCMFADGTDTTLHVLNNANPQQFTFSFNKKVKDVLFDKNNRILLKEATVNSVAKLPDNSIVANTTK